MREHLTGRSTWGTPPELFNILDSEFGFFDVDVCANEANAKCLNYFSDRPGQGVVGVDDALQIDWEDYGELFFMNPPFSIAGKGVLDKWLAKARATVCSTPSAVVVALIPCAPSERWWGHVDPYASEVRLLTPRVPFILPNNKRSAPPHGSAVIVFRYKLVGAPTHYWRWRWRDTITSARPGPVVGTN